MTRDHCEPSDLMVHVASHILSELGHDVDETDVRVALRWALTTQDDEAIHRATHHEGAAS